jgi:hypothetical protein
MSPLRLGDGGQRDSGSAAMRAFFDDLGVAYFALGAMIGADRKTMVESLRPRPEG